ncbi:nickel-dependent hydrogenase large subunit [Shigella flexneri]
MPSPAAPCVAGWRRSSCQGRDPRDAWAFVERSAASVLALHALASVYAIEDAIGIKCRTTRCHPRIMLATLWCHDHLVHFYQLAGMDWIDVLDALRSRPQKPRTSREASLLFAESSPGYFFDVQNHLKKLVEGGQSGIFAQWLLGAPAVQTAAEKPT